MADYLVTDTELTGIADAIRTKGGTSSPLAFPSGFESAITAIATGKDFVSGTITCPNEDTQIQIDFGKTFNHYLFILEMTDDSKSALVASQTSGTASIAFIGVYPKRTINSVTVNSNMISERYIASSNTQTSGGTNVISCSSTYLKANVRAITEATLQSYLIRGYSYNYTVVSLD